MKLARYVGGGTVEIQEQPAPNCPKGGLLIKTLASGLCSGELMDWYMDLKAPHVLGHEVSGVVVESQDERFPVGCRVAPHHHAPCLNCEFCRRGDPVHCEQWKRTKLDPGGMAEVFAVDAANLNDTHRVDDLRPTDAALMEPLGCVAKSIRRAGVGDRSCAVIGLGAMGLMHLLALPAGAVGYDFRVSRRGWAEKLDLTTLSPEEPQPADVVFVCPGTALALDMAIRMANPGGTVLLFAPMPPDGLVAVDINTAYFKDLRLITSYSCGPDDTTAALQWLRSGRVRAENVVSDFCVLDALPDLYRSMKGGDILKAMVTFP
jgi:L-iditol 2-dehydrogenase